MSASGTLPSSPSPLPPLLASQPCKKKQIPPSKRTISELEPLLHLPSFLPPFSCLLFERASQMMKYVETRNPDSNTNGNQRAEKALFPFSLFGTVARSPD